MCGICRGGASVTIIEAALHAEDGTIRDELDGLIVVDSPEDIRIERLMAARGLSHAEAIQRIRSQTPPEKKLPLASWIIHNNLGLDELHEQVEMIIKDF